MPVAAAEQFSAHKVQDAPPLLYPMGLGEIAARSFKISIKYFPTLFALAVLFEGPVEVLVRLGSMYVAREQFALGGVMVMIGVLALLPAYNYCYAATAFAVSLHIVGLKPGFMQILRRLRGRIGLRLLGTGVLQAIWITLGFVLLIIPGIILTIRYFFASPVVVLEHKFYSRALRRSRELVKGYGWRIVAALLFTALVLLIGQVLLALVLSIPLHALGIPQNEAVDIAMAFLSLVLFPFFVVYGVLLYYDLRVRKEAFNVEAIRPVL
jgi:hypothetical protein